jgi:hypothetical protein
LLLLNVERFWTPCIVQGHVGINRKKMPMTLYHLPLLAYDSEICYRHFPTRRRTRASIQLPFFFFATFLLRVTCEAPDVKFKILFILY